MIDFPEELLIEEEVVEIEEEEVHSESERQALHNYGPFKEGKWYLFLEGHDYWNAFSVKGKKVYAPKWVF